MEAETFRRLNPTFSQLTGDDIMDLIMVYLQISVLEHLRFNRYQDGLYSVIEVHCDWMTSKEKVEELRG